jgi:formylglycine-generating enzyme required for sulfatase activity
MLFRIVQRRVRAAIRQEPYLGFSALGDVYLAGKDVKPTEPSPTPARLSEAAEAWSATKDTTSIAVLEALIGRYKDTFFAELARARVDELKKQQVATAVPPKLLPPAAAKPVEPATPAPSNCEGIRELFKIGLITEEDLRRSCPPVPAGPTTHTCAGVDAQVGSERTCLKPKDSFKDCDTSPEMVVVPAGSFTMGSPANEPERIRWEEQVRVSIATRFAVGKYAVTFDEWDACVAVGGCNNYKPSDQAMGRVKRPVINVGWNEAKSYVVWLSAKTGKTYRLLSEAEREYVTRADTTTAFWLAGQGLGKVFPQRQIRFS